MGLSSTQGSVKHRGGKRPHLLRYGNIHTWHTKVNRLRLKQPRTKEGDRPRFFSFSKHIIIRIGSAYKQQHRTDHNLVTIYEHIHSHTYTHAHDVATTHTWGKHGWKRAGKAGSEGRRFYFRFGFLGMVYCLRIAIRFFAIVFFFFLFGSLSTIFYRERKTLHQQKTFLPSPPPTRSFFGTDVFCLQSLRSVIV